MFNDLWILTNFLAWSSKSFWIKGLLRLALQVKEEWEETDKSQQREIWPTGKEHLRWPATSTQDFINCFTKFQSASSPQQSSKNWRPIPIVQKRLALNDDNIWVQVNTNQNAQWFLNFDQFFGLKFKKFLNQIFSSFKMLRDRSQITLRSIGGWVVKGSHCSKEQVHNSKSIAQKNKSYF